MIYRDSDSKTEQNCLDFCCPQKTFAEETIFLTGSFNG